MSRLGSTLSPELKWVVMQYQNIYDEYFIDQDFYDSSPNNKATWGSGILSFFVGFHPRLNAQSLSIDYNNGTITNAIMEITATGGTYNLWLSADGGTNWEAVTSGVAHAFTNTGTDLRWKIAATSTGDITNVNINSYH